MRVGKNSVDTIGIYPMAIVRPEQGEVWILSHRHLANTYPNEKDFTHLLPYRQVVVEQVYVRENVIPEEDEKSDHGYRLPKDSEVVEYRLLNFEHSCCMKIGISMFVDMYQLQSTLEKTWNK